ncbi:MAG: sugar phosphate nucleotidyltransferase [Bacteroidota bacterium]
MKPTLLILAAGMGSRYGGLKQLDAIGPNGETIIDYSVYDAIRAGFGKAVFVIRAHFANDFKAKVTDKFKDQIEVAFAYQEIDTPIEGLDVIPDRAKPWGTAHAMLVAADVVQEPFAVLNADDFYGVSAFQQIADFLTTKAAPDHYGMVGYVLQNTLSANGSVSRGVADMDGEHYLKTVVERHKIERIDGTISHELEGLKHPLSDEALVSMNFWGFHPNIFAEIRTQFLAFVKDNPDDPKAEFYIPLVANRMVQRGQVKLKVLTSRDQWYGVTYQEDKPDVLAALERMTAEGRYPSPLWKTVAV